MSLSTSSEPFVIETAGAARFVHEAAQAMGQPALAQKAGQAALHMRGISGLSDGHREDVTRVLAGDSRIVAGQMLTSLMRQGGVLAEAAEAILVELTDPEKFWAEIYEAKAATRAAGFPDDIRLLEQGAYPTGPVSAIDLVRVH